jgi:deoxyribodipyrimidine photo-lyase
MAAIVWLRRDLRLADNPALRAAMAGGRAAIPAFVWSPEGEDEWAPGTASRWWLHQSLEELRGALERRGARLVVRRGPPAGALVRLARECGADAVFWNGRGETAVARALADAGIAAQELPGNLLFEPGTILNRAGQPFRVFTAFWKACLRAPAPDAPLAAPRRIPGLARWPESLAVADLGLEAGLGRTAGLSLAWQPGERSGQRRMKAFLGSAVEAYARDRDRPDREGTSRLSPHLHFGEVSARQAWRGALAHGPAAEPFLRQLAWREFAHHLLFHYPETRREPLRAEFRRFPWLADGAGLRAWQRGMTGYPLVDAGMRELWQTGWMHNRVRMVAASFLVKHLLIPWQEGAAWFRETLVDADPANNTLGWQWCAGCGADAAPYFRIFNPAIQAAKFDPEGSYVRRWVPELAGAGKYPQPIVAHEAARRRALEALAAMRAK